MITVSNATFILLLSTSPTKNHSRSPTHCNFSCHISDIVRSKTDIKVHFKQPALTAKRCQLWVLFVFASRNMSSVVRVCFGRRLYMFLRRAGQLENLISRPPSHSGSIFYDSLCCARPVPPISPVRFLSTVGNQAAHVALSLAGWPLGERQCWPTR